MYASNRPMLRIEQSDLKCKSGCDFYGNPKWEGYCSKCYRELSQRQRKTEQILYEKKNAEKAQVQSAATLPKAKGNTKREEKSKLTANSSFSKFEEKRSRKSETLKKSNPFKFNVFRKTSADEPNQSSDRSQRRHQSTFPIHVLESHKADFRRTFPDLDAHIEGDVRFFVFKFIEDVSKRLRSGSVDDLAERVQCYYQLFVRRMDTLEEYANVGHEKKEELVDFVEKHVLTYLHDELFSPPGTDDERADVRIHTRINQLSWMRAKHLDCAIEQNDPHTRQMLYNAIKDLMRMDGEKWGIGKVQAGRAACRRVLSLLPACAAADDLLPALIFTILKANPPRLISNINYVTRFCYAPRLMTGEGGYYFTNLCCAVSFIENLTAESLSMDKEEFDCYMSMPPAIGGSSWVAALSLCESIEESNDQKRRVDELLARTEKLIEKSKEHAENAEEFERQIDRKVTEVLSKTPLKIKKPKPLRSYILKQHENEGPLVDIPENSPCQSQNLSLSNLLDSDMFGETDSMKFLLEDNDKRRSKTPQLSIRTSNSTNLLSISSTPLDARSLDDLITADDLYQLAPGLSNVNYDIDLSDFSADNSLAEDSPPKKDPFSPEFMENRPVFSEVLQPHRLTEGNRSSDGLNNESLSLLDEHESPTAAILLPLPLQPQAANLTK